jgi:para-aminobenzoate synthetase component I
VTRPCAVHLLERLDLRLPFWRYYALLRGRPYGFLLDSASDPDTLGRFSFMGNDPFLVLKVKRVRRRSPCGRRAARLEIVERPGDREGAAFVSETTGDVFAVIRRLIDAHRVDRAAYVSTPVPFLSGVVGYFGYEAGHFVEEIPDLGSDDLGLPDIYLMFVNSLLAHCHRTGASYLSVVGRGSSDRLARADAEHRRGVVLEAIEAFEGSPAVPRTGPPAPASSGDVTVKATFDEAAYCRLVGRAKERIYAGEIFEICLSQRLESPFASDAWGLYEELRSVNPAPFACCLDFPEATVVSSSPERFLRLGADGIAESRPIKGTRPRGRTPEEDRRLLQDLRSAAKDQAEHNMIVDLVRSDLGRVCRFGSVNVPALRVVEPYATVHQLVSTIRGRMDEDKDGIDLLRACFPGGSMTGAPKIEAMKIIDELEPTKRAIYSGSIGYLDFSGPLDLSIVIRTIVLSRNRALFNVGGAIVADSEPRAEYEETLDKAKALITALRNASAGAGAR